MSGRLIPAAATAISTSPAPGTGSGSVVGCSTSGPPNPLISIAVIVVGSWLIARVPSGKVALVAPLARTRDTGNRLRQRVTAGRTGRRRHVRGRGSCGAKAAAEEKGPDAALDRRARGLHRREDRKS